MGAEIRASYTKLGLKHFKRSHPEHWERLVQVADPSVLEDLRKASTLAWLPAELHGIVADAIIEAAGRSEARALWSDVILGAFDHRMLAPIVSAAMRLYGKTPPSIMRMTPHAWPLVFRECGHSWMEPISDSHAAMAFAELPRAIMQSTGILDSFIGNCDAALRYTGYIGSATPSYAKLADASFSIDVHWQKP